MRKAYVHLPDEPSYRRDAFIKGFGRLGYGVFTEQPTVPIGVGDFAVVWNRTGRSEQTIRMALKGGGGLMVAENGFYGKDAKGRQSYALALDGHNGSGRWFVGGDERLKALDIEFKPWRVLKNKKVLIADQRGIGSPLMRSPADFGDLLRSALVANGFDAKVRTHPGREAPTTTLKEDLEDVQALIVWSSNSATSALIDGIPTFYYAPTIVTAGAAQKFNLASLRNPNLPDREEAFKRMSWAQWFVEEIESGEALSPLIDVHHGHLPATGLGVREQ